MASAQGPSIGPSLLAAPLLHNNYASSSTMTIYLPAGKWIDIETGTSYSGPTTLTNFNMPLDKTPVFVGGKGVYNRFQFVFVLEELVVEVK